MEWLKRITLRVPIYLAGTVFENNSYSKLGYLKKNILALSILCHSAVCFGICLVWITCGFFFLM
jgi:hypothetical protein